MYFAKIFKKYHGCVSCLEVKGLLTTSCGLLTTPSGTLGFVSGSVP